jgi:eukaryotic-like serine/threonine-protein kinase
MHHASKDSGKHSQLIAARLGTVVKDKWHLDRLIGTGGMAAVYAATHRNGKRVAIKMLHPELARSTDVRTRFLREGYLANAVGHDGVVSVSDDDFTDDGTVFLVMELLEGETLERRWERKGRHLTVVEVLSIANELLDVLAVAHGKGIIHRDIKPENVFVTHEGKLKILDFGIARLRQLSRAGTTTQNGTSMGTPAFMAPEQARGRWDEVDARSDVWAVGATMFSLLTGRFVHVAGTPNEQLLAAMTTSARPITSLLPDLEPEVAGVIDRALAYRVEDRWTDARAMRGAIREALRAIGRRPEPLQRAPRPSISDTDETIIRRPRRNDPDTAGVDELIRRTEHGLTNAPSAAPEQALLMRRSPFVVGIGAGLLGVAITLAAFVHRGSKVPVAAAQAVHALEQAPVPTVDVASLPRAMLGTGTPSPPATGVPATLPAERTAPGEPVAAAPVKSVRHTIHVLVPATPAPAVSGVATVTEPSSSTVERASPRTDGPVLASPVADSSAPRADHAAPRVDPASSSVSHPTRGDAPSPASDRAAPHAESASTVSESPDDSDGPVDPHH